MIVTLNGGASSVKYAIFGEDDGEPRRLADGAIDRIGAEVTPDHAVTRLFAELAAAGLVAAPVAVGHRVVHGGERFDAPCVIGPETRAALATLAPLDPAHMPFALRLVDEVTRRWPDAVQVACFDTAFHRTLPAAARLLPLPRRLLAAGVRRYGFHGLSYASILDQLGKIAGPAAARARLVIAHLGSGASLAAVVDGRCVDTTMAFTPTSGVPMGTRSGDLDPGVLVHLMRREGLDADALDALVNRQSGLLGMSGTSADVRDLLARAPADLAAAEAIDVFCHEVKKRIGGFVAVLGGLDTLVFTGGIGERSAPIRARILSTLGGLGIFVDEAQNHAGAPIISPPGAPVVVRVMATDEERVIATETARLARREQR